MVGGIFERSGAGSPVVGDGGVRARVVSGVALATVALTANYVGGLAFASLIGVIVVAMAWEWGKMVRGAEGASLALGLHVAGVLGGGVLVYGGLALAGCAVIAVAAAGAALVAGDNRRLFSGLGVIYVGLPALALIHFRGDPEYGMLAVLLLFIVVWGADTFAYVTGKLIGGPRLWPSVSGQKTWAGSDWWRHGRSLRGSTIWLVGDRGPSGSIWGVGGYAGGGFAGRGSNRISVKAVLWHQEHQQSHSWARWGDGPDGWDCGGSRWGDDIGAGDQRFSTG